MPRALAGIFTPEEGGLLGRRQGARMPAGVAQVYSQIDSGKNKVDPLPVMHPEGDAIRWRAVHPISFKGGDRCAPITQRSRGSDRMAHRRLLDVRCYDSHLAKMCRGFRESENSRAVDSVVVRNENAPFHLYWKRVPPAFWPNPNEDTRED